MFLCLAAVRTHLWSMGHQVTYWCSCKKSIIQWQSSSARLFLQSHTGRERALLTQEGPSLPSTLRNPDEHFEGPPGTSRCDFLMWLFDCFLLDWKQIYYLIVSRVLLSTSAACCVCSQRWQAESSVLGAVLVPLTFLSFGKNYVFKRQCQKSSFQNSELFSSQSFLEGLKAFCYPVCVEVGERRGRGCWSVGSEGFLLCGHCSHPGTGVGNGPQASCVHQKSLLVKSILNQVGKSHR